MASANYRHCDVCDAKVFYDATLNYEHDDEGHLILENLGAWNVLCDSCAKTHEIKIVKKANKSAEANGG